MILGAFPFLYAETHYRLPFLFNRLFKKEPELIADVPYRVLKSASLPVLLLVKDAHLFPTRVISVKLFIDGQRFAEERLNFLAKQKFNERILEFDVSRFSAGWHEIQIKITYEVDGKTRVCFADNYRTTRHRPFRCYFAAESLPRKHDYFSGDFHSHSSFTEDQIEFGASLSAMKRMAEAVELDFFCVTDHSYDLDDAVDNYLKNDPSFPKWQRFQKEVKTLNSKGKGPLIIPGEEVSVRNAKNQTVHLLILNHPQFIPGSGDSGERWFSNKSELSVKQILSQIDGGALAIPAHPAQKVPFAQKLFINRGPWTPGDLLRHHFNGLQFINGNQPSGVKRGMALWKSLLLQGKKIFPAAGNDAHGHFNRVREIAIPFIRLKEHGHHVFGQWRTLIHCSGRPQHPQQVLDCFKKGRILLTNGPFLEISAFSGQKQFFAGQCAPELDSVKVEALANHETGAITQIVLWAGFPTQKREQVIWQKDFTTQSVFSFSRKISLALNRLTGYIRAEIKSEYGMALTNCIWIED
ncbi:PHP domain protein [Caldithrix abyssi DSM 13497]|uniref:PHP domain protein n=1 Tax=Caldithrix abyssi DSM 13497 TaxID=880073 RepID=H1XYX3_CALAY|nr:PHP domain-containing protein [Caldithrix abyssi]APF17996.1 hypothetical protein Cabys_1247 [Caldithrix abyssi DSM 13497]EHO42044.1 PHP domain protein [Caldithrix abyssi DSM 13497]